MQLPISDKLRRELLRFLIIGGIAVSIDAVSYTFLVNAGFFSPQWAKRISFVLGAIWAFFMNKFYTFSQKDLRASEPLVFAVVYFIGWALNSACHDIVLDLTGYKSFAFLCATGLSTCTNFIGQKWIVFRQSHKHPVPANTGQDTNFPHKGSGMLFNIAKNSAFLQNMAIWMHSSIHPSIEHNLGKLSMIKKAMFHCELEQVPGSYFEFGIFEGTSLKAAVKMQRKLRSQINRNFYGFDAFEGFKYFDDRDKHPFFKEGDFKSTYGKVKNRFRNYRNVKLIKGYFEETINGKTVKAICGTDDKCAICFVDCDLSSPAYIALKFIQPALQAGSIIILDDYWAYKGSPSEGTCGALSRLLAENPSLKVREFYRYGHGGCSFVVTNV